MYTNYEVLHIIEYKSYLTISVCMHEFVKSPYTYEFTSLRSGDTSLLGWSDD